MENDPVPTGKGGATSPEIKPEVIETGDGE